MERLETDLEMAERHVRDAECAVETQRERIAKMPTEEARESGTRLLHVLERCLVLHRRCLQTVRSDPTLRRTVALADDTVEDCLDRARYASDRADEAKPADRAAWLEIAKEWSSHAAHRRKPPEDD